MQPIVIRVTCAGVSPTMARPCPWVIITSDPDHALDQIKQHIGPGHPITMTIRIETDPPALAPATGFLAKEDHR